MNIEKYIHTLPLAGVALALAVTAAKLANNNQDYGWFLCASVCISWWVYQLLQKAVTAK